MLEQPAVHLHLRPGPTLHLLDGRPRLCRHSRIHSEHDEVSHPLACASEFHLKSRLVQRGRFRSVPHRGSGDVLQSVPQLITRRPHARRHRGVVGPADPLSEGAGHHPERSSGSARARIEADSVVLMFQVRRRGNAEWKTIEQRVPIIKTACHFGGSRPWFRCDACGSRVAVIYRAGDQFACRSCCKLSCASQHELLS
jgi:hypothetical protein